MSSSRILIFHDLAYPGAIKKDVLNRLVPLAHHLSDAAHLTAQLEEGCTLLVSFHGPYFPRDAWPAILRYLERGGNLACFGGMPFTRPVTPDGQVEPEHEGYTSQLFLGPFYPLDLPAPDSSALHIKAAPSAAFFQDAPLNISAPGTFWSFYPKLTQIKDHPEDRGSGGPLDTLLTPLLFTVDAQNVERPLATPAVLLDQQSGRFKGGRWLLSPWQPASVDDWLTNATTMQRLIGLAAEGFQSPEVRPALACHQPGEAPVLVISAFAHGELHLRVSVSAPGGEESIAETAFELSASSVRQEQRVNLPALTQPGLYRVRMRYWGSSEEHALVQESGFWIWDEALVEQVQSKGLSGGRDYFYQEGKPFLAFGTTYMDSRIQRKFLHLPNPARWDRDFAEMQASGVNIIRTGIWTAWREHMAVAGVPTETTLRALDAFVMTACRYNIQVIFTFFSFYPPIFEGENTWLDPRSIEGQRAFITAITERYAQVALISWDLINEPSFGDPATAFNYRAIPNYDRFELAEFRTWLAQQSDLAELRRRWRKTPADLGRWEQVTPPTTRDYGTGSHDNYRHDLLKVVDYVHFSQEMFARWAANMYEAIRASGSQTLVGVGQDEAGVRPAPQFYASAVDYTTSHPWWNNDDLLWDMLLDKTLEKPNVIQEIGVMLTLDVDMHPWRSEQECADLLERKLITGLIARGAGLIQWLWHTNAYMISDNENSIGLVRTDGSAKPELRAFLEVGRLVQALQARLLESPEVPETWVITPYSQWFQRLDFGLLPTRQAIRVLGYDLGIIPQVVGEHQLAGLHERGYHPRHIIVPGIQTLREDAWQALRAFAAQGATVLISGVSTRDPHNQIVRPGPDGQREETRPVNIYEELEIGPGETSQLAYREGKIRYVRKAHNQLRTYKAGAGTLYRSGLPLELAADASATRRVYRKVLGLPEKEGQGESVLLCIKRPIKDGTLILLVSESGAPQRIALPEGIEVEVAPGRAGAVIIGETQNVSLFGGIKRI